MNILINKILVIAAFIVLTPTFVGGAALAQGGGGGATSAAADAVCEGVELTGGNCNGNGNNGLNRVIEQAINIFSIIIGVIAVIMIMVGGLKYITSGGDSAGVSSAKNTILYAVVGLVVVAMAQIIVKFVLNKVK